MGLSIFISKQQFCFLNGSIWFLLHERMPDPIRDNLNKSLQKVFLLPQFLGIFPLKLGPNGFSVSPLILIASAGLVICISVWTISNLVLINLFLRHPVIYFLSVMTRTIFIVFMGACILTSLKCVRKMNHIFDDLWCIDTFLSIFGKIVENSFSNSFSIISILLHIILFLYQRFTSKLPMELLNVYLSFIFTHAAECQYVGMLDIFFNRFQALNKCLKKLRFNKDCLSRDTVILSNVHLLLSESLSKISKLYSVQLFLFTAISLARFIVFLFSIVFSRPHKMAGLFILVYVVFPFWLLLSFLMFFRVIRMIVKVTREPKLCLHIAMKKEIVFTACGFFRLDYTLVHSMIAATTTYLVILIQFGQTGLAAPMVAPHPPGLIGNLNTTLFPSMAP
ncbi:Gustatory receptor 87a [Halyomorpha halys]|nr:Gustatory receptor 87a [Halyomorpha halys]